MGAPIDLTNRVVGLLTVLRLASTGRRGKGHHRRWLCRCRCGNFTEVSSARLAAGTTRSCGCLWRIGYLVANAKKFIDLTGKRFGRLKVVEMSFKRAGQLYWRCRCRCGSEMLVAGKSLKSGATRSCGCYQRERASAARRRACLTAPRGARGRFAKAS
jgi:hypothetical protein